MMMYSLFGLIPMIAMLLFVAVCIMTIVRAVVIPAEVRRGSRCGGCGYEIADLTTERCSECGAKLLRVGITTPAMIVRHRSSGIAAGLAWTALVGAVSMLSMSLVSVYAMSTMSSMNYQANRRFQSTNTFSPPSEWDPQTRQTTGNDYSLAFVVDVVTDEDGIVESGEIEVEITNANNQTVVAVIDPVTFLYTIDNKTEPEDEAFDVAAVTALFESLGYDAESESFQRESSQIESLVFEVPNDPQNFESFLWNTSSTDPFLSLQRKGASSSSMPAGGVGGLPAGAGLAMGLIVFWLIVWATGLALLTWRRRRLFNVT